MSSKKQIAQRNKLKIRTYCAYLRGQQEQNLTDKLPNHLRDALCNKDTIEAKKLLDIHDATAADHL